MKLLTLQMYNLRQHADSFIAFPAEGVIGLVGPNEAGKSTVLEAVTWALFGSRALRGTKSSLRWNRAPARRQAGATLRFEVGGRTYMVDRMESKAELYEEADGRRVPIADGTSAVDAHVPKLLGMTLDEFSATYLCAQRDLGRLAAMGPTERQGFIRRVMGLERIDEALKACRAKKNDLQRERDGLAAGLGDRDPLERDAAEAAIAAREAETVQKETAAIVERQQRAHESAAAELGESERRRERAEMLHRELDRIDSEGAALLREQERQREELAGLSSLSDAIAAAESRVAPLETLRAERAALTDALAKVHRRQLLEQQIEAQRKAAAHERDVIQDAQHQIDVFDAAAYGRAQEDLAEAELALDECRTSRERERAQLLAKSEAAGKEANLAHRRIEAIEKAGAEGACPTCQRVLGEQIEAVVAQLTAHRDAQLATEGQLFAVAEGLASPGDDEKTLSARVVRLRKEVEAGRIAEADARKAADVKVLRGQILEQMERDFAALETELQAIGDADYDADRAAAVEAEIAELERVERQLVRDRAAAERIPTLERAIEKTGSAMQANAERAAEVGRELEAIGFDREAHVRLVDEAAAARQQLEAARIAAARAASELDAARQRHTRATEALDAFDRRAGSLRSIEADLRTHTAAADRLDAFRVAQASTIRPELEELTTGFISILTDGRHDAVTISEDFEVTLHESGLAAEVVSGGTEDVAAIALRLAISQMVAERAGHPLSLLILDEPFGSLDEVRRAAVLNLIRRLGGTFEQVLVISHVAETKDAVDHVIEVEYDEATGASSVVCPGFTAESEPVETIELAGVA